MEILNLQISEELKAKLLEKIKETEFNSLEEYIKYILEKVVEDIKDSPKEQAYTAEEEKAVKKRLEELGYL